mmetsp:Transcript_20617/g.57296  ORF Transcript_20617/g.57296 Transcript_20617/m.57296 type:complete len:146 (+) Transcript_20617:853-1290(+)
MQCDTLQHSAVSHESRHFELSSEGLAGARPNLHFVTHELNTESLRSMHRQVLLMPTIFHCMASNVIAVREGACSFCGCEMSARTSTKQKPLLLHVLPDDTNGSTMVESATTCSNQSNQHEPTKRTHTHQIPTNTFTVNSSTNKQY